MHWYPHFFYKILPIKRPLFWYPGERYGKTFAQQNIFSVDAGYFYQKQYEVLAFKHRLIFFSEIIEGRNYYLQLIYIAYD